MGEEPGIRPKAISFDHRGEEATAWSIRWTKKKPFPMTIESKKPLRGVSDGRRNPHFL